MDFSEFRLKGFKPFKQEATLPTSDITLIYGPNSGGKSSLIHSLLLLSQTAMAICLRQIAPDDLQFNGPLVQQGTFKTCVHRGDTSKEISFTTILRQEKCFDNRYLDYVYGLFQRPAISLTYSHADKGDSTTRLAKRAFRLAPAYSKEYVFVESIKKRPQPPKLPSLEWDEDQLPFRSSGILRFTISRNDVEELRSRHHEAVAHLSECNLGKSFARKTFSASAIWTLIKAGWCATDATASRRHSKEIYENQGEIPRFLAVINPILGWRGLPVRASKYSLISRLDLSSSRVLKDACALLGVLEINFIYDALLDLKLECRSLSSMPSGVCRDVIDHKDITSRLKELEKKYPTIVDVAVKLSSHLHDVNDPYEPSFDRYNYSVFHDMASLCLELSLVPTDEMTPLDALYNTTHIGPLRPEPQRVYNASQHNKSSSVDLNAPFIISQGGESQESRINQWFKRLQIPYELRCRKIDDDLQGPLYTIYLVDQRTKAQVTLADVGFGISQLLPIIVQCTFPSLPSSRSDSRRNISIVQQPEIHLHPRLQAELADLFIETITPAPTQQDKVYTLDQVIRYQSTIKWIIETHSEILLQRMLRRIREGRLASSSLKVIYVEPSEEGSSCIEMKVSAEGELLTPWPNGFFDSQLDEVFA